MIRTETSRMSFDDSPAWLAAASECFPDAVPGRSVTVEQLMILGLTTLVALEDQLGAFVSHSVSYLVFAGIVGYALIFQSSRVIRVAFHPVFAFCYFFLLSAVLIESCHPMSDYGELKRIASVVFAGIGVAAIASDMRILRAMLLGLLIGGSVMSVLLLTRSYSSLEIASAENFAEASVVRSQAQKAADLEANLNGMAITCGLGAAMSLAIALKTNNTLWRLITLVTGLVCFLGSFVPMSRSGVIITLAMLVSILKGSGLRLRQLIPVLGSLLLTVVVLVPTVFWQRMTIDTNPQGRSEPRVQLYQAALDTVAEYIVGGVGNGQFWESWGYEHGFRTTGAHNAFLHTTICWGAVGLVGLLAIVWYTRCCLPCFCAGDAETLGLMALSLCSLGLLLVTHNLYLKQFALTLGLLVGGRIWIWPHGSRSQPVSPDYSL